MAPARDRTAVGLAVLAHLLVAGVVRLVPPSSPTPSGAAVVVEVALDEARVDDAVRRDVSGEPIAGSTTAAATEKDFVVSNRARPVASRRPLDGEQTAEAAAAEARAATPDSGWTFNPARRSPADIGIGSHWKDVVAAGGTDSRAEEATSADAGTPARAVDRAMRDGLAKRDVELGLGRAGPLVTATREAASSPEAPDVGASTLEVESDAAGSVIAARADDRAWDAVATAIVRRMAGRSLRVPPGARGIRARLRVAAERTLPAGARGTSSPGAVPDDIAGGRLKVCEGEGMTRRCIAGMPVGVTKSAGDLSNIGATLLRVVHVQLLEEAEL